MIMISFMFGLVLKFTQLRSAHGQITNATCRPEFNWMYNSKGQSPCLVAAYAQGACEADGGWTIQALPNSTVTYSGPDVAETSLCTCSSVAWALCSACSYCQGDGLSFFSDWIENCPNSEVSNGQYPIQVPGGTDIPLWAYQQTAGGEFNVTIAQSEAAAAASSTTTTGPSSTSSLRPASSSAQSFATSTPAHKTAIAPIVGGAVGGGIGTVVILGIIIWLLRRYRRGPSNTLERPARMDPSDTILTSPTPPISQIAQPPMKFYNPEDPSTFPAADLPTLAPYPRSTSTGYVVDIDPHYPVPPSIIPHV